MTPHFALKVAAAKQHATHRHADALAVADSIIRALVDANAERDAALKLYASELARLTFHNATLAEDNRLMVEAVVNWPHTLDRAEPKTIVH